MLRRFTALTGLSAAALLALPPAANAELPTTDGVGLTYGVTTVVIDATTGAAGGALEIAGLDRG
ncbi:hypothetical protein [Actinophytocola sp. KF-1]